STEKKRKLKIKILNKFKIKLFQKSHGDTRSVVLDFKQNLQQHHLAEADRQLLEQEVDLFISESPDEPGVYTEGDEDKLQMDYESLMLQLRIAIEDSFKKENQEMLRSAVATILQEEQRDRHWMELEEEQRPRWRPLRCRQIHDTLLKKVVEKRLQQVREVERGANDLSTSLKTEVCRMGKQIQRDLLLVVKEVQRCYSPDFDVCNMYAQLYHQAFSTRLMELARSNINLEECTYILSWINTYYPKDVLQQQELESHINSKSLGALLPEEDFRSLEEQYLSHTEADVRTWLSNGLKKEVESWKNDKVPELIDGYFFSYLALDIINVGINHVDSFHTICKSHSMFDTNIVFTAFYVHRKYIEERQNLPDNMKAALLSGAADLRDSCHKYLLSPIHSELKVSDLTIGKFHVL
uniref:Tumor necrosis factor, alpha-induced protein 2b n=1 Tax=Electrophorus electricus TaxID=8005 RepID=A0A4W4F578_ELEEL